MMGVVMGALLSKCVATALTIMSATCGYTEESDDPHDLPAIPTVEALNIIEEIAPHLLREVTDMTEGGSDNDNYADGGGSDASSGNADDSGSSDLGGAEITSNSLGTFEATFYTAFCPTGCTGVTASGYDVSNTIYSPEGYRVIAVDRNVIPLNSVVKVTLSNGDSFTAKALDTGGAIKGSRIDVLVASRDEAYRLGRMSASVEVIQ